MSEESDFPLGGLGELCFQAAPEPSSCYSPVHPRSWHKPSTGWVSRTGALLALLLPCSAHPHETWLGHESCLSLLASLNITGSSEVWPLGVFLGEGQPRGPGHVCSVCPARAGPPSWLELRERCVPQVGAGVPQRGEPRPGRAPRVPGLCPVLCRVSCLPLPSRLSSDSWSMLSSLHLAHSSGHFQVVQPKPTLEPALGP